ncbi:hypothetical protein BDY24DRAFT_378395 [Mrakia frigida]|uniref:DUF6534 domain-containing protein n=1 Tax=Mrakia frigida TaxID=29902 RepID=UPI003FCBF474
MPVQPSDFFHLSQSEQDLIQDHINEPVRFQGMLILASLIDCILFGIVLTEFSSYWRWFKDGLKFKGLVCALFILNLAQTSMVVYNVFNMFGSGFGDWAGTTTNVYFEGILMMEAITGSVAQSFFLERAFTLMKKKKIVSYILLGFSIPGILAGLACGLGCGIITVLSSAGAGTDFANFDVLTRLIIGWKGTTVLTDLILTGSIVYCLLNSRTGWRQTDSAVTRLVRWIVEAQALPLFAALFFLASYAADSAGNVCLIPSFMEAKLACISVFHVLNSRGRLRHDLSTEHTSNKISGPQELTTKGRVQIQTLTQVNRSAADEYDIEVQRNHQTNSHVRGNRIEDGDDISLESFENGKGTSAHDGETFQHTDGSSQAKLVPVVPFEQMRW